MRVLPRTTLSFDEFLSYYQQDNVITDNPAVNPGNFGFVLGTVPGRARRPGTPVDLGNIWSTQTPAETLPCATSDRDGHDQHRHADLQRIFVLQPGGRIRGTSCPPSAFASNRTISRTFEMSGSVGYSTSDYHFSTLDEVVNGWTARTAERGKTAGGPVNTKRVSVNADWSGVYAVNDKLRILDMFRYDNWRIPGVWDTADTTIFGTPSPGPGVVGMLLAPGVFNSDELSGGALQPGELPATHRFVGRGCDQRDCDAIPGAEHQVQYARGAIRFQQALQRACMATSTPTERLPARPRRLTPGSFIFRGVPPGRRRISFLRHAEIAPWLGAPCPPAAHY